MTDEELKVLQKYYEKRKEGNIEFQPFHFDNKMTKEEIDRISLILFKEKYITGKTYLYENNTASVYGKITAKGIELIEQQKSEKTL